MGILHSLKNHPFAVSAFFKYSLVLTYGINKHAIKNLIPECLELDTFEDKWAVMAVAMVQTKTLRPKGFPSFFGNDFFLIGYRIFTRYTNQAGKRLRGLYILRSDTDKKKMQLLGNLFTHYKYQFTDITQTQDPSLLNIYSLQSGIDITVEKNSGPEIPESSPFKDWKQARRFAGPLPFTFSFDPVKNNVLIVEGVRQYWTPTPVKVLDHHVSFFQKLVGPSILCSAFMIENIPYYWKKGKIEAWKKP